MNPYKSIRPIPEIINKKIDNVNNLTNMNVTNRLKYIIFVSQYLCVQ